MNYIPHHGVTNVNKPDKVRVVFDAGATYNSTSLSQNHLKGPNLLNSLVGIFIHFRVGRFAVMGDIEQMFHQILVENEHRDAVQFLWRNNFNDPIDDYRINVHLFGKIDSLCIANWTVKRLAKDQSELFGTFSIKTIEENFYMDDFLSSFHDTAKAIKIFNNVINILSEGGFRLHKFRSNNRSILSSLPQANVSSKLTAIDLDLNEIPVERALGILRNPESDTFKIKYAPKPVPATKRGILSHVSSIFDPLGFITPALIEPQWIVQELRRRNLE